jgi:sugar O-acyltransferase (sialic acid O-acetyltransferase NeuD family)
MTENILPLVIIGAGGFGREVLELVRDINAAFPTFEFLGFLDDGRVNSGLLERVGAAALGPAARVADVEARFVVAIAAPDPRRRIDVLARSHGRAAASLVHPWATVGSDVRIGDGAIVAAGARLTTNVVVGRHAHVNFNCTIGHDVVIEDFATLFPGVHVSGGCVIGEGATLGTGCVIVPNVRVGSGATVGAGAVVVRDVEPGTTVVGPAARPSLGVQPGDATRR